MHGTIDHRIGNRPALERVMVLKRSLLSCSCRPERLAGAYLVSDIESFCARARLSSADPDDSRAVGGSLKIVAGKAQKSACVVHHSVALVKADRLL